MSTNNSSNQKCTTSGVVSSFSNWSDCTWLGQQVGKKLVRSDIKLLTGHGGAIGELLQVSMELDGGDSESETLTAIIKTTQGSSG